MTMKSKTLGTILGLLVVLGLGAFILYQYMRWPSAPAVLIVDGDRVSVHGQVSVAFNADGGYTPEPWVRKNVVVFRTDGAIHGETGKAGIAYKINAESKLEKIGKINISKPDGEICALFGVRTKSQP